MDGVINRKHCPQPKLSSGLPMRETGAFENCYDISHDSCAYLRSPMMHVESNILPLSQTVINLQAAPLAPLTSANCERSYPAWGNGQGLTDQAVFKLIPILSSKLPHPRKAITFV